jgi:menaquinone-dependent protoporphyrinogen oxidase
MKVLVAAASRHGATQEIAEAIGRALDAEDMDASVATIEEVGDPTGYDAVILGSAPIGDPPRPGESQAVNVDDLVSKTRARGHKLFAGKLDKGELGFGERAVMLAFRAAEGDYRDWHEVEAWARAIAGELRP